MPTSRCTCASCGTALKFATPLRPGEEVRCPRCADVFAVPERPGKGHGLPWWLKAVLLTGAWSALLVAVPATSAAFLTEDGEHAERMRYVFGQLSCLPWLAVTVLIWVLCYSRGTRADDEGAGWPAPGRRGRDWDERRPRRGGT